MTSEEALLEKIRVLPPSLKQEAEHYIEFLQSKAQNKMRRASPEGVWADSDNHISENDIRKMRKELWANFPREYPGDKHNK